MRKPVFLKCFYLKTTGLYHSTLDYITIQLTPPAYTKTRLCHMVTASSSQSTLRHMVTASSSQSTLRHMVTASSSQSTTSLPDITA